MVRLRELHSLALFFVSLMIIIRKTYIFQSPQVLVESVDVLGRISGVEVV